MGPVNIGAVARSMNTFGLEELVLVAPHAEVDDEARKWAVHGEAILAGARTVDTLEESIEGLTLVLGLTRREGKRRHRLSSLPAFVEHELPSFLPARLGLMFGNEESGLSNPALDLCSRLVSIPTHPTNGSMNLAHAVTATLYELHRQPDTLSASPRLARPEIRARMLEEVANFVQECGYPHHQASLAEEMTKLADIAARARLEEWEIRFLMGMLKQVRYSYGQLKPRKKGKAAET